jgi:hypothetical protein
MLMTSYTSMNDTYEADQQNLQAQNRGKIMLICRK